MLQRPPSAGHRGAGPLFPVYDIEIRPDFLRGFSLPERVDQPQLRAIDSLVSRVRTHVSAFHRGKLAGDLWGAVLEGLTFAPSGVDSSGMPIPTLVARSAYKQLSNYSTSFSSSSSTPELRTSFISSRLSLPAVGGTVSMLDCLPPDMADLVIVFIPTEQNPADTPSRGGFGLSW